MAWRLTSLAAILLLCALVRVWNIRHAEVIARDGVRYTAMARQWSSDPPHVCRRNSYHPGYPAATSALHGLLGEAVLGEGLAGWDRAGQIVSLTAGLLATTAVWVLAGVAFNWRVAWITALLFGCGRKWSAIGADVLSDALAVCLQLSATLAALWALHCLRKKQWRAVGAAALVGLCGGAGYLVRGEAVMVVGVACIAWLVFTWVEKLRWRQMLAATAVAAVLAAACAAPYMAAIGGLTRKKVLGTPKAATQAAKVEPNPDETVDTRPALVVLGAQWFEAIHPVLGVLVSVWAGLWLLGRLAPAAALSEAVLSPARSTVVFTCLVIGVSAPILLIHHHNTGFMSHRYLMFIAALLAPLAGAAVVSLQRLIVATAGQSPRAPLIGNLALAAGMLALTIPLVNHALAPMHAHGRGPRLLGERLRADGRSEALLTDNTWVWHYAECPNPLVRLRRTTAESFLQRLRSMDRPMVYAAVSPRLIRRDDAIETLLSAPAFDLMDFTEAARTGIRLYRVKTENLPERAPTATETNGAG